MGSMTDLTKLLNDNPPSEMFTPYCHIDETADALTVYFENEPDYSERLTNHVTLYRSLETDSLVGCRIKGISGVIEDLPNYLNISHDGIELKVLLFAFRGEAKDSKVINELAKTASDKNMVLQQCG